MSKADIIFKDTIKHILENGISDEGQNVRPRWKDGYPAYTLSVLGVMNRYNLTEEFPIVTLRPTAWQSGLKEILWIYQDRSNDVKLLEEKYGVKYWRDWANSEMNLGTGYGHQLTYEHDYPEGKMNQIDKLIYDLKNNPTNRRMIVNLYNHTDLSKMTIYPCCFMTIWNVKDNKLNMTLIQRSSDFITANNINLTQYALLQHMIAQVTGYEVGELIHFIQDCHIYLRHLDIARDMLRREPKTAPVLLINKDIKDFYDFTPDDFVLADYKPHQQYKIEVAI